MSHIKVFIPQNFFDALANRGINLKKALGMIIPIKVFIILKKVL